MIGSGSSSVPFFAKNVEPVLEPAVPSGSGTGSTVYRFGSTVPVPEPVFLFTSNTSGLMQNLIWAMTHY